MAQRMATTSPPPPVRRRDIPERFPRSIARAREAVKAWLAPPAAKRRVLLLERLLWVAATLTVTVVVWYLQDRNHPPLVWDEAVRMQDAALFAHAFQHGDLAEAWKVMNQGAHYPFLAPLIHSLVLVATGNIIVAAWLPSLVAYAFSGVLAGRLAAALGGGRTGAWIAAILCWLTPINARVAGGAFTETMGGCLFLILLIMLTHLERGSKFLMGMGIATTIIAAWYLKYDYGVLAAAVACITVSSLGATFRRGQNTSRWLPSILAVVVSIALFFAAAFLVRRIPVWDRFIAPYWQKTVTGNNDWMFYPYALIWNNETGLTGPIRVLLVLSSLWLVWQCRHDRRFLGPFWFVVVWYIVYSSHLGVIRFFATLLPVLAAVAGTYRTGYGFRPRNPPDDRRYAYGQWIRPSVSAGIVMLLCIQLLVQATGDQGVGSRFSFLEPDMPAEDAYGFTQGVLRHTDYPTLMIGQANEFNAGTLRVPAYEERGFDAPPLVTIPELPGTLDDYRVGLIKTIKTKGIRRIIGLDILPRSRFDTTDLRSNFPSQGVYLGIAKEWASHGALRNAQVGSFDSGRIQIYVWDVVSIPAPTTETIESVNATNVTPPRDPHVTINGSNATLIRGWAVDHYAGMVARSVNVVIDGTMVFTATYGDARPDVARVLGRLEYANSGWHVTIPANVLRAGEHTLSVETLSQGSEGIFVAPRQISLTVR